MAVTVRPAAPADIPAIVEFNCRLAEETEGVQLDHETVTRGVTAVRSCRRAVHPRISAAIANRPAVSHAGLSQASESFDSGTVRPHRTPAALRDAIALRC